jgi:hypothetical protein
MCNNNAKARNNNMNINNNVEAKTIATHKQKMTQRQVIAT